MNELRKLIREELNKIFETSENRPLLDSFYNSIMNCEIKYGMKPFSSENTELKERIVEDVRRDLVPIIKTTHAATDLNLIKKQMADKRAHRNYSEYEYLSSTMYFYRLGSFETPSMGKSETIYFKTSDDSTLTSNSIFSKGADAIFAIVYKDEFIKFGFYDSEIRENEIINYMKSITPPIQRNETVPNYKVSNTFSKLHSVRVADINKINQLNQPQPSKSVAARSLNRGSLVFIPNYGWGQIKSLKVLKSKEYEGIDAYIEFPKEIRNQIKSEKPELRGKRLNKSDFSEYLKSVDTMIKKFDYEALNSKIATAAEE